MGWLAHLRAIGRPDLGRDLVRAMDGQPAYICGRCAAWCEMPYAIPCEPKWVCESCAKGRGQPGSTGPVLERIRGDLATNLRRATLQHGEILFLRREHQDRLILTDIDLYI